MTNDEQDLEPTPQVTEPPQEPQAEPTPETPPEPPFNLYALHEQIAQHSSSAMAAWNTNGTSSISWGTGSTTNPSIQIGPFSTVFPPKVATRTLQYDGPSDTVYIAIHKGERLTVTPDMDAIIQRLTDEGHQFSTVD